LASSALTAFAEVVADVLGAGLVEGLGFSVGQRDRTGFVWGRNGEGNPSYHLLLDVIGHNGISF
jgi:hypothetical protein